MALNDFPMATEDDGMVLPRQKYGSTDVLGNYSEFAKARAATASG